MGVRVRGAAKMKASLSNVARKMGNLPKDAYNFWKSITPVRSGNARRRTRLQGSSIKANYNYAVPLDKGSSKQAPRGMSEPTDKYIKDRIARHILRK